MVEITVISSELEIAQRQLLEQSQLCSTVLTGKVRPHLTDSINDFLSNINTKKIISGLILATDSQTCKGISFRPTPLSSKKPSEPTESYFDSLARCLISNSTQRIGLIRDFSYCGREEEPNFQKITTELMRHKGIHVFGALRFDRSSDDIQSDPLAVTA